MNQKNKFSAYWAFCLIGAFFVVSISYLLVKGQDVYVQIHDNLDSNIVWYKMLKDNGLFFAKDAVVPMLNGVDRNLLPSPMELYTWLYILLPVEAAYFSGYFLRILMAIGGSFWLAKSMVGEEYKEHKNLIALLGFLYGVMPYFPTCAFSFASLPACMAAVISFYKSGNWELLVFFFFYPILSSFAVHGIFICGYLLLLFIIDWISKRKPSWRILLCLGVLSLGFLIIQWDFFRAMLQPGAESIRDEFPNSGAPFVSCVVEGLKGFIRGQYHAATGHEFVLLPVCGIYFLFLFFNAIQKKSFQKFFRDPYLWILLWIGFNAVIYGIDGWQPFKSLIVWLVPALKGFSFARTLWFNAFLFCVAFGIRQKFGNI